MFSLEVVVLLIVALINLAVFWMIASQGWRQHISNKFFLLSNFFVLLWALGTALFFAAPSIQLANIGITIFYVAPMFTITFLSLFASSFLARDSGLKVDIINKLLIITSIAGVIAILVPPALLTE